MKQKFGFSDNEVLIPRVGRPSGGHADSRGRRTLHRGISPKSRRLATLHWIILLCFAGFSIGQPYYLAADTGARIPGAMTKGCLKGSCCTSKCYLDKNGVHHCVHKSGDSCDCGLSSGGEGELHETSFQNDIAIRGVDSVSARFALNSNSVEPPDFLPDPYLSIQTPPPRVFPS